MTWRIGIDNGLSGAIVAVDRDWGVVLQERMPVIKGKRRTVDMVTLRGIMARFPAGSYAVLEFAQTYPVDGRLQAFSTGYGYGAMQMCLVAHGVAFEIRRPRAWHKAVGIVTPPGKDSAARKKALKAQAVTICQRRLPTLDLTPGMCRKPQDGLADAGCMALDAVGLRPW